MIFVYKITDNHDFSFSTVNKSNRINGFIDLYLLVIKNLTFIIFNL